MRRGTAVVLALAALAGCASRPRSPHPYIPPEATYSAGSTLAAFGGVATTAVGAHMLDPDRSVRSRKVGAALAAAGGALLAGALIDAVHVEEARKRLYALDAAWRRAMIGSASPEEPFRPAPPPSPELPFVFEEKSPLSGREP